MKQDITGMKKKMGQKLTDHEKLIVETHSMMKVMEQDFAAMRDHIQTQTININEYVPVDSSRGLARLFFVSLKKRWCTKLTLFHLENNICKTFTDWWTETRSDGCFDKVPSGGLQLSKHWQARDNFHKVHVYGQLPLNLLLQAGGGPE